MKAINLTKEEKAEAIEAIKSYFFNEKDEEITDLAASLLLDFILKQIGPLIYNQALKDAHYFMTGQLEDLFSLEKHVQRK